MYELNVPVISELLLTVVLTGVLVFVFQKVFVERWLSRNLEQFRIDLQRTIQNESRQLHFIERQIEEFYSPMLV